MLPCCGFFMLPSDDLMKVTIVGCAYGIDWSVIHDGDNVRLVLEDGKEEVVTMTDYREEVYRFADKIEAYYEACPPKKIPKGEFDRDGYVAFWNEWHRRREKNA